MWKLPDIMRLKNLLTKNAVKQNEINIFLCQVLKRKVSGLKFFFLNKNMLPTKSTSVISNMQKKFLLLDTSFKKILHKFGKRLSP